MLETIADVGDAMTALDHQFALQFNEVGKRFGRRWVLADATVAVPRGSVVALVGPNAAGKTTLLHLAVGLITPDAGTVAVLGTGPRQATVCGDVGFVAQDKPLYRRFRVSDLLTMGASLNSRWDQEYAISRLTNLGVDLRSRAGTLSGGAQAQVALAKRPKLLPIES